jgi:hypothetical protein
MISLTFEQGKMLTKKPHMAVLETKMNAWLKNQQGSFVKQKSNY